jgi:hypothetical protein
VAPRYKRIKEIDHGKKKQPTVDTSADVPAIMAAIVSANPVLAKAWTDMMSESARFMAERLETDIETQKALMACRTPAALMEVQSAFLNTAVQQYADQAARMFEMTIKASRDVADDLQSGHSRGYDDIPV